MARTRTDFGQRMLAARRKSGLSQPEVAKAIGIAQSTLSELENTANGSQHTPMLAKLYGVGSVYLATGEVEVPAKNKELPVSMPNFAQKSPQNRSAQTFPWAVLGEHMKKICRHETREDPQPDGDPAWFVVETDEMHPSISVGDEVLADPSTPLKPGAIILCMDTQGTWHLRRVQDIGGGEWVAAAENTAAYGPLRREAIRCYCRVSRVSKVV